MVHSVRTVDLSSMKSIHIVWDGEALICNFCNLLFSLVDILLRTYWTDFKQSIVLGFHVLNNVTTIISQIRAESKLVFNLILKILPLYLSLFVFRGILSQF